MLVADAVAENRRKVISIEQLGLRANMLDYKGNSMASLKTFRTPYEIRLQLVADTISAHSKLGNDAASRLAVHVLLALNSIPEKMR